MITYPYNPSKKTMMEEKICGPKRQNQKLDNELDKQGLGHRHEALGACLPSIYKPQSRRRVCLILAQTKE